MSELREGGGRESEDMKRKAFADLTRMAQERGKTLKEFLDTDVRAILEKAWEIQQRTGKSVSIEQLYLELNE